MNQALLFLLSLLPTVASQAPQPFLAFALFVVKPWLVDRWMGLGTVQTSKGCRQATLTGGATFRADGMSGFMVD